VNPLGVALDARALIARGWTQPSSDKETVRARLEDGTPCGHMNPKAAKFSLGGAVLRAAGDDGGEHLRDPRAVAVFAALKAHLGEEPSAWANQPGRWNTQVLDALDAVIEKLRREAP